MLEILAAPREYFFTKTAGVALRWLDSKPLALPEQDFVVTLILDAIYQSAKNRYKH